MYLSAKDWPFIPPQRSGDMKQDRTIPNSTIRVTT